MEQNLLQNTSFDPSNPLFKSDTPTVPNKIKKFQIPSDPKIKVLLAMMVILLLLSISAIFVSVFRKKPVSKPALPTPIPTSIISPTEQPKNIPSRYLEDFTKIEDQNTTNQNLLPPKIDASIGL